MQHNVTFIAEKGKINCVKKILLLQPQLIQRNWSNLVYNFLAGAGFRTRMFGEWNETVT